MANEIYYNLRDCLDQYTLGFASTESEVEIEILESLFTVEEADMYLNLTDDLQSAKEIAEHTNRDPGEVEEILKRMTEKGLVFAKFPSKENECFYYAAAPFAHGIFEHTAKRLDSRQARLFDAFFKAGPFTKGGTSPTRIIPVNQAVDAGTKIMPYDDIRAIIRSKKRIAITDCSCTDLMNKVRGKVCDKPKEVCMAFDFYAQHYIGTGMGREITLDEALARLDECEEAGLVPQFGNSENPEVLCNCCPDCCMAFPMLNQLPKPGRMASTNYFSQIDADLCTACETCIDRCPMDAISMDRNEIAEVNLDRCIGCGLCVTTCPADAISLKLKPVEQQSLPPERNIVLRSSIEMEASIKS